MELIEHQRQELVSIFLTAAAEAWVKSSHHLPQSMQGYWALASATEFSEGGSELLRYSAAVGLTLVVDELEGIVDEEVAHAGCAVKALDSRIHEAGVPEFTFDQFDLNVSKIRFTFETYMYCPSFMKLSGFFKNKSRKNVPPRVFEQVVVSCLRAGYQSHWAQSSDSA